MADFQQQQYAFAAYIRDPDQHAIPADIEARRMAIYRDLFFNNLDSTLETAFPVIHTLLPEQQWLALVREFLKTHHCKTPIFSEIPREFIAFLQQIDLTEWPFLTELAEYEYVELVLDIDTHEFEQSHVDSDEILTALLRCSPLARLLIYRYPVHQISFENQPHEPGTQPTCLIVYRDKEDNVKFMELNPVSARLLDLVCTQHTGQQAVEKIAVELQQTSTENLLQAAKNQLADWINRGILLTDK